MMYEEIKQLLEICRHAFNELPNKKVMVLGEQSNTYNIASRLDRMLNQLENTALIAWDIEDVQKQADDDDIEINREQSVEVLNALMLQHDASVGVNWDVISQTIATVTGSC